MVEGYPSKPHFTKREGVDLADVKAFFGQTTGFLAHAVDELRLKDETLHGLAEGAYTTNGDQEAIYPLAHCLLEAQSIGGDAIMPQGAWSSTAPS